MKKEKKEKKKPFYSGFCPKLHMSFNPTTTVAGTTNARIWLKIPDRYGPISCTPPRMSDAPPANAAMINTVATIRNSFVSFPLTFRNPTIKPNTTNKDASHAPAAGPTCVANRPSTTAIITPPINE